MLAAIGEGGMGQVWRARDTKPNRDVALRVLPDSFAHDPDHLARFTREAQTVPLDERSGQWRAGTPGRFLTSRSPGSRPSFSPDGR